MKKNILFFVGFITITLSIIFFAYLKLIPSIVANDKTINYIEKLTKESLGVELKIEQPELITILKPIIVFKVQKIALTKSNEKILNIENLETIISYNKIFKKQIDLKKFNVDDLYININKLTELNQNTKTKKTNKKNSFQIHWLDSLLSLKNCTILYNTSPKTQLKVNGKNLVISSTKEPKSVRFDIQINVKNDKNETNLSICDEDKVYIKNHKLFVDHANLFLGNSQITIDADADEKNNFNLLVYANKFNIDDIIKFLKTDIVIPNSEEVFAFYKDINGNLDFKINIHNNKINGDIKVNSAKLKVIPIANLPVIVTKGNIKITNENIVLNNFKGLYGTNKANFFNFEGIIKDYTNSVDTYIEIICNATNDLTQNYLSKLIGSNLTLTGQSKAKTIVKSKYNKIDLTTMFKIPKGKDILVENMSLSPTKYDRAISANFYLDKNLLDIKSIEYYIAQELTKGTKNIKPILTINGKMDIEKLKLHNIGFNIPKPLPSEFLNVLANQKIFKNGQIAGNMDIVVQNNIPKMQGTLSMTNVRIPSQRLSIKKAVLSTNKNLIKINADGRYKRSQYQFNGLIKNELIFPIIIKDINLSIDDIDIEKILKSMAKQPSKQSSREINKDIISSTSLKNEDIDDEEYIFNPGILIVEKCILKISKGKYKQINFGNLIANLTLNKNGILEVKSNRFDFAEGYSSLKVFCDLLNQKYNIKLGVNNIDSDKLATSILSLEKEISGRAKGFVNLNTDETLKLNGNIKFEINKGNIQKVGLVQYALNFASLFRNPMAMLSPSIIFDLVNIPEGNFDKINGSLELKNNVAEKIIIKSSAPQLSAFIIGKYDLELKDASLRIYTKFSGKHKGLYGFLRNISLNSLANKMTRGNNNETNYYALELEQIPPLETGEENAQIFLTKVEGDVENFNFLSSLKKIK